jgi:hypothetical protein
MYFNSHVYCLRRIPVSPCKTFFDPNRLYEKPVDLLSDCCQDGKFNHSA